MLQQHPRPAISHDDLQRLGSHTFWATHSHAGRGQLNSCWSSRARMTLPCVPIFLATSRCSPHDWFSSLTTIVHVDHASVQHIRDLSNLIDTTVWHRPQLHRRTRLTLPDSMRWIQHMHEHANHRTLMRHTHHQLNKLKDRRRRPEGGWMGANQNSSRNLAYVPKSTRSRSLLTRSRLSSYRQAIGLRNWARNCNRDTQRC
jgi:hypothetical protein